SRAGRAALGRKTTRMLPAPRSPLRAYAVAVLATGLALLARLALDPLLGDRQPFCTFYFAVAAAAWAGGLRPALLAVLLGSLAGDFFFVTPRYVLAVPDPADMAGRLRFAALGRVPMALAAAVAGGRCRAARRGGPAVAQAK